jgi:hypothetical protein
VGAGKQIDQSLSQVGSTAVEQARLFKSGQQQMQEALRGTRTAAQETSRFQSMLADDTRATALATQEGAAKTQAAIRANESALRRARAQWSKELTGGKFRQSQIAQQTVRMQELARAEQMAALKTQILAREQAAQAEAARRADMEQIDLLQQYNAELDAQNARVRRAADAMSGLTAAEAEEASAARASASAHEAVSGAMETEIPQYAATSAMVRLMEGNMNNMVRAAERFVGQLSALQGIAMTAFPVIGGIAMTDLLVHMAKKAWDATENFVALKSSIEGIAQAEEDAARAAAQMDQRTEGFVEDILRKTRGEKAALQQKLSFTASEKYDLSRFFEGRDWKKEARHLPNADEERLAAMFKSIAPGDIATRLSQINNLTSSFRRAMNTPILFGVGVQSTAGFSVPGYTDPVKFWTLMYHDAHEIQTRLQAMADERSAQMQDLQIQIQQTPAGVKRKDIKGLKSPIAQAAAEYRRLRQRQAAYRAQGTHDMLMFQSNIGTVSDLSRSRSFVSEARAQSESAARWIDATQNSWRTQSQLAADAMTKMRIAALAASGQITKLDAASAVAALHQKEYSETMAGFNAQIYSIQNGIAGIGMTPHEKGTAIAQVEVQRMQYQTGAMRTAQSDAMAMGRWQPGSTIVAVRNALDDFVLSVRDVSGKIGEIVSGAVDGVNRSLSDAIMAHSYNSWEWRQHIMGALGGQARQIGAHGLNLALGHAEGAVLGKFGFGKGKRGDTTAMPLYVHEVGAAANASSVARTLGGLAKGSGGVLGLMGGVFQGFFANGGAVLPGIPAIVGERGPELFTPPSAGRIVPNRQLMGNVTHEHHYNIDARGAHDPAAVEAAVHRGIAAAAPQIVGASVKAVHGHHMRIPTNRRY